MTDLLNCDHSAAIDPAIAGGKGASLARLARAGFAVPLFRILPVAAYHDWLAQDDGFDSTTAGQGVAIDDPVALERVAKQVQERLSRLPFPVRWRPMLAALDTDGGRWAVRSSGVCEDAGETAAAGLHESYLGVRGTDGLADAARQCFLSVWSARAIAYRAANALPPEAAGLAVVLQKMVDADTAGVAFSADPVHGDLDVVVIEANHGLGESVVAGEVDVDRWRLAKADGAILDTHIGGKAHWVPATGSTLQARDADPGACLDTAQIAAVRELACALENHHAWPQDCEWAFAQGRLWLLQSRPITRMAPRWTRDESAERFPNAMSRLTWSVIAPGFQRSFRHSMEAILGVPYYRGPWFECIDGYVYGDRTAEALYTLHFRRRWLDRLSQGIDVEASLASLAWVHELAQSWQRDQDVFLVEIGRLQAIEVETLDDAGVLAFLQRVRELGERWFLPNIAISFAQRNLYALLYAVIQVKLGSARAGELFDDLLAPVETRTSQVNRDALALSRHLRAPALAAAIAAADLDAGLPADIVAGWPAFARDWTAFLAAHGHRETDIDLTAPTWGENPAIVRDLLLAIAGSDSADDEPAQRWHRRQRAVAAQRELLDAHDEYRHTTSELIELARSYTVLDDVEHYQTTRLHPLFRRGALALGRRWCARGVLERAEAVFCLDFDELAQGVAQGPQAIAAIARREWDAWDAARKRTPRWSLADDGAVAADTDAAGDGTAVVGAAGDGTARIGVPGSAGVVEAAAFVVDGPEDFGRMPAGAVLVARTTNPAWTPLFYRASAIVTECGGPLSHGAVTARELGLPAVMGVRDAMTWLRDGVRVRVEGQRGRVLRLEAVRAVA